MNFDLFGQSPLAIAAILSSTLTCFLIMQMKKRKGTAKLLGVSILLAVIVQLGIATWLGSSESELPAQLWLMLAPWFFSIALIFGVMRSRKNTKMSKKKRKQTRTIYILVAVNILGCFALAALLVNGYYRFYPTLYGAIGLNRGTLASLDSSGQVILQYNSKNQSTNQTLETSLYGNQISSTNGQLLSTPIPGKISKFHTRNAWIYVPAIAHADPNALNLPVLVLLPGVPGAPTDWLHGVDLVGTLDSFAKQHHGITPIVVVVDDTGSQFNDTECVNSPRGNVETYLTEDVPNYIEAHFPVSNSPNNWAIGGLSMGGSCAAMLTLDHPNVYQNFLDMGGEIGPNLNSQDETVQILFGGSLSAWQNHQPAYLLSHRKFKDVGGFFASGDSDDPSTIENTKQLYLYAKQDGLTSVYETVQGPHTFNVFEQIFKDALPWLSNRSGATSCTGGTTTCN